MMKITGRIHIMANNGMGKPSSNPRLFTISMIMNGITSSRLMSAGDLRVINIFFMAFPSMMSNRCSRKIPSSNRICGLDGNEA
jgi:hypothetical protein